MNRGKKAPHDGCLLCGRPLVYSTRLRPRTCALCHRTVVSNAACEADHFVCDACHASDTAAILALLVHSREQDPVQLLLRVFALPSVHLHGPEHHSIVPCVLLTAYHNCGGALSPALPVALQEACRRGAQVPGGACGYWGVCGASAGAGIYASIVTGSNPLNEAAWALPHQLTAQCSAKIAGLGGVRCCKRTARIAVETAAAFTRAHFGVDMPASAPPCTFSGRNRECLGTQCPYYED